MFSSEVYRKRREELRKILGNGVILILGNTESPMNYPANPYKFRQDSSFLYFFGVDQPGLAGIMDIEANSDYIFGDDVDIEDIIWMGPQEELKEKAHRVGIEHTAPFKELHLFIQEATNTGRKIHYLPPYRAENKILLESLLGISVVKQKDNASVELVKGVVSLRSVKDEYEIREIEKACAIGYEMHTTAMKMCRSGVYEREIAGFIEGIALSYGGTVSFPIILSQNGQTLHNHDHSQMLQTGRLTIVDAGAETSLHYASDFTRTLPVGGKFSTMQKEIYEIVLKANNTSIESIKAGVTYLNIHLKAAEIIASGLKDIGLMQGDTSDAVRQGAHAMFFPHGLGHMMGLDVHDMEDMGENYVGYNETVKRSGQFGTAYLRLAKELQPGFVLTVEPGIYFIPELIEKWEKENRFKEYINYAKVKTYIGFGGIRLEDNILVTDSGCRIVGKRIPVTVKEVEEFMRQE